MGLSLRSSLFFSLSLSATVVGKHHHCTPVFHKPSIILKKEEEKKIHTFGGRIDENIGLFDVYSSIF